MRSRRTTRLDRCGLDTLSFLALYDDRAEALLRFFARRTLDPRSRRISRRRHSCRRSLPRPVGPRERRPGWVVVWHRPPRTRLVPADIPGRAGGVSATGCTRAFPQPCRLRAGRGVDRLRRCRSPGARGAGWPSDRAEAGGCPSSRRRVGLTAR